MTRFFANSNMVTAEDEAAAAAAAEDEAAAKATAAQPTGDNQNLPGGASSGDSRPPPQQSEDPAEQPAEQDDTPGPIEVPENIQALRSGRLYDADGTYREDIKIESPEVEAETVEALQTELRNMAADVGLSSPEAREMYTLAKTNSATPPDEAQLAAWKTEATDALSRKYGADAHEALEVGNALLARDPRLGPMLRELRLLNHPRVIETLIARAYAERKAGRL